MNNDVKAKWIKALRSGKYKQTQGTLKDKHGFCCMGVLCDLYDTNGWGEPKSLGSYRFLGETGLPPKIVSLWADLNVHQKQRRSDKELYQLNDMGSTFLEIADIIEEEF